MSPGDARFAALYDRYFDRVYAYVRGRVATAQDAEDLTAETFLRAMAALPRFVARHPGAEVAWLFRIAHNQISNHRRARARAAVPLEDAPMEPQSDEQPDEAAARAELAARLRDLVAGLAPRHQEVIALRFFAGLRNQEIAEALGLDQRTVAAHLSRALAELQRRLGGPEAAGTWSVAGAGEAGFDPGADLRRRHTGLPQAGDPPAAEDGPIALALALAAPAPDEGLRERVSARLARRPGPLGWLRRLLGWPGI